MYESYGNVAYSLPKRNIAVRKHGVQDRQYRKRHRADPQRIPLKTQSDEERITASFHRDMAKQRMGRIFACIAAVSILTAVFAGILYRNSKILEMNYANVRIEREIKQIEKEKNQLKEELSKKTDLAVIRSLAIEKLGMQDPGQKQISLVVIPAGDRMIIDNDAQTDGRDTRLSSALTNIEGFFKTLR